MKKHGVNDFYHEGPLAMIGGAAIGGLLGGGGTLAGFLTADGLIGSALGAVGGSILGKVFMPKMDFGSVLQQPQQPPESAIPATPPAPAMPAAPATPASSPVVSPSTPSGLPEDTSGPGQVVPFNPGEAAPMTTEGITKGELTKKRRGRVSTILTTPATRAGAGGEDEDMELLGG